MFTGRILMRVPGIFAPSCSDTPSLGCTVSTSWFGLHAERAVLAEGEMRDGLQRDRDLGDLARQALAGAQVERHARPAPVVDLQAQRRVGLGRRARRARPPLRGSPAPPRRRQCPAPYCARTAISGISSARRRVDRVQHLDLLVAHLFGREADRRLHRDVAEQLEHVVLDQVAQRAGLVVVAGAGADADVLGRGDLHVVDVVAVPQRLEHAVGEAERQHVLDGLLAQVVVDAEDLRLVEDAQHPAVEFAAPPAARSRTASR